MDGQASRGASWKSSAHFALTLLFFTSLLNYFDRALIAVVQEPLKADLRLADWQLGILSGPAFALLYSVAGIPVARFGDKVNRPLLLTWIIAFWSIMTGLCGAAGNFIQLLLFRMGVGLGEGGSMPISHSMIGDMYPAKRRGWAMSVIGASAPVASLLAPLTAANIAAAWGWRAAFVLAIFPGLILAVVVKLTMRDPRPAQQSRELAPPSRFTDDLRWAFGNKAFVFLVAGGAMAGAAIYGHGAFAISFLIRVHGFELATAGMWAAVFSVGGLTGTLLGGALADKFSGSRQLSYLTVPAVACAVCAFSQMSAYLVHAWTLALPLFFVTSLLAMIKIGATFAAVQNEAPADRRAVASALFMFGATTLGMALGPVTVGTLSDVFARSYFTLGSFQLVCPGGLAEVGASPAVRAACEAASAAGLRMSMVLSSLFYLGAAICFGLAAYHRAKSLRRNPEEALNPRAL